MPFLAKCHRCNYVVTALTRFGINQYKASHESKSHKDYGTSWTVTVITEELFYQLEQMQKLPAFWQAYRASPKQLSRFSGLG
jgi:hypothetical protein